MNYQQKQKLINSFISGVGIDIQRTLQPYSIQVKRRLLTQPRKTKSILQVADKKRIQTQNYIFNFKLPQISQQKRKSFVQIYQQKMIRKSLDKPASRYNSLMFQQQKYKPQKINKFIRKYELSIHGFISEVNKKGKQMMLCQQNKQFSNDYHHGNTIDVMTNNKQMIRNKKMRRVNKNTIQEKFNLQPWKQKQTYF